MQKTRGNNRRKHILVLNPYTCTDAWGETFDCSILYYKSLFKKNICECWETDRHVLCTDLTPNGSRPEDMSLVQPGKTAD